MLRPLKTMGPVGAIALAVTMFGLVGCGKSDPAAATTGNAEKVTGKVNIDGSSTVSPIVEAAAEEFMVSNEGAEVTVAVSGTGGGFKKFLNGEIEISNASRPISESEMATAKEKGLEFIELPIAFDGLTIAVNPNNTWCDDLTVEELKKIWEPGSKINNWNQVRAGFPDKPLKLYGAGTDSGTFDYFTLAINGEEKASRTDYQSSEDDNVLVQGVAGDEGALGYFGYAYFEQSKDKLKAITVGGVAPSPETIADGTYQPLSRPLFIYVKKSDANSAVVAFANFILDNPELVSSTGYIAFPADIIAVVKKHLADQRTGSKFHGAQVGLGLKEILEAEGSK